MTIYCIDASSLIWAKNEAYPMKNFPSFWNLMTESAKNGLIISTKPIYEEIIRGNDDLVKYAKENKDFFLNVDEGLGICLTRVMRECPSLIDPNDSEKNNADPFLVALALYKNGIVVTQENSKPSAKQMKIPDACKKLNVDCFRVKDMIKQLGWCI